jgi:hypothetical protein
MMPKPHEKPAKPGAAWVQVATDAGRPGHRTALIRTLSVLLSLFRLGLTQTGFKRIRIEV